MTCEPPPGLHRTAEEPTLPAHRPSRHSGHVVALPGQARSRPSPTGLERFNAAAADTAERALIACCGSHRWARRLAAHRPYPDLASLLAAADEAAYDLTPADLSEALAHEPLPHIPADAHSAAHTALSAAHAAYEARFSHVFVNCLDDMPPEETLDQALAAIRSRLANDPEEERCLTAEELRRLAKGRLSRMARTGAPPGGRGAVTLAAPPRRDQPRTTRKRHDAPPLKPPSVPRRCLFDHIR